MEEFEDSISFYHNAVKLKNEEEYRGSFLHLRLALESLLHSFLSQNELTPESQLRSRVHQLNFVNSVSGTNAIDNANTIRNYCNLALHFSTDQHYDFGTLIGTPLTSFKNLFNILAGNNIPENMQISDRAINNNNLFLSKDDSNEASKVFLEELVKNIGENKLNQIRGYYTEVKKTVYNNIDIDKIEIAVRMNKGRLDYGSEFPGVAIQIVINGDNKEEIRDNIFNKISYLSNNSEWEVYKFAEAQTESGNRAKLALFLPSRIDSVNSKFVDQENVFNNFISMIENVVETVNQANN